MRFLGLFQRFFGTQNFSVTDFSLSVLITELQDAQALLRRAEKALLSLFFSANHRGYRLVLAVFRVTLFA